MRNRNYEAESPPSVKSPALPDGKTTATAPITPSSLSETPFSISLALTAFSILTTFDIEYGSSRSRQGKRRQKTLLPICLL